MTCSVLGHVFSMEGNVDVGVLIEGGVQPW